MQHLVERLYEGDFDDLRKTVSRFEYETREARNKLDIAELYIELNRLKAVMKDAGIEVPKVDAQEREKDLIIVTQEDHKNMEETLSESIEYHYMTQKEKKGLFRKAKTWGTRNLYVKSRVNKSVREMLDKTDEPILAKEFLKKLSNTEPIETDEDIIDEILSQL